MMMSSIWEFGVAVGDHDDDNDLFWNISTSGAWNSEAQELAQGCHAEKEKREERIEPDKDVNLAQMWGCKERYGPNQNQTLITEALWCYSNVFVFFNIK